MKQAPPWWFFFPDVTFHYLVWLFCIAAVPWGWCDFSRLMWLKYSARIWNYLNILYIWYQWWHFSPILTYTDAITVFRLSNHLNDWTERGSTILCGAVQDAGYLETLRFGLTMRFACIIFGSCWSFSRVGSSCCDMAIESQTLHREIDEFDLLTLSL